MILCVLAAVLVPEGTLRNVVACGIWPADVDRVRGDLVPRLKLALTGQKIIPEGSPAEII
jgi:hypothetical protein